MIKSGWIKKSSSLISDLKTIRAARALGWRRYELCGLLCEVWSVIDREFPSGEFHESRWPDILEFIGCSENHEAILAALIDCGGCDPGFIDKDGEVLSIHGWAEWTAGERWAKQNHARYMQKWRKVQGDQDNNSQGSANGCEVCETHVNSRETHVKKCESTYKTRQDKKTTLAHSANERKRSAAPGPVEAVSFEAFWREYPRKTNKAAAEKAWRKVKAADHERLMEALEVHKASRQWQEPRFVPFPAKWLGESRWRDEGIEVDAESNPDLAYRLRCPDEPPSAEVLALMDKMAAELKGAKHE